MNSLNAICGESLEMMPSRLLERTTGELVRGPRSRQLSINAISAKLLPREKARIYGRLREGSATRLSELDILQPRRQGPLTSVGESNTLSSLKSSGSDTSSAVVPNCVGLTDHLKYIAGSRSA